MLATRKKRNSQAPFKQEDSSFLQNNNKGYLNQLDKMTKMKGLFKGMKFISQIFVQKEHEMEIGYPTDVKHVAHIGWDNATTGNSPCWMNKFKTASDFSPTSVSNLGQVKRTSRTAKGVDQLKDVLTESNPSSEKPPTPKKVRKKKIKGSAPTEPSTLSTTCHHQTRAPRPQSPLVEDPSEVWTKIK